MDNIYKIATDKLLSNTKVKVKEVSQVYDYGYINGLKRAVEIALKLEHGFDNDFKRTRDQFDNGAGHGCDRMIDELNKEIKRLEEAEK